MLLMLIRAFFETTWFGSEIAFDINQSTSDFWMAQYMKNIQDVHHFVNVNILIQAQYIMGLQKKKCAV